MTENQSTQDLLRNAQYILNDLKKVDQILEEKIDEFEEKFEDREPSLGDMRRMYFKKQPIVALGTIGFKKITVNKISITSKRFG